jgi:hypothetical protein
MSHFPNSFWGGVVVTFLLHLVAMWLYHHGPGVLLSPIAAAWRSSSQRARTKQNQLVTLLRSNREELYLATLNEVLYTVRFFALAGAGTLVLLLVGLQDFLLRHFPAELAHTQNVRGTQAVGILIGVFSFCLALFEAIRSSDTHALIRAAKKPSSEHLSSEGT